ncbi:MAG TPA: serine protease [Candidatus Lustribacter sp.]
MRKWLTVALFAAAALAAQRAGAANDASAGYAAIRPSLVKVWAFDHAGRPTQSGTGIVVDSSDRRSLVLTASHVIAGAASIRIDVSRALHDLAARVDRTGPHDLTLLSVDRGGLPAARFAPRTHAVVEGNLVAVAGYVKKDELIGVTGQQPRVLFPGTVSSRPDNGIYLELENVHIEEGLSGGAVFDPGTGEILGIVTSRTSDRRGGFADSGALVVVPFLSANNVAAGDPALPPPVLRPLPIPTLQAVVALFRPRYSVSGIVSWQAGMTTPKRFVYTHGGYSTAVTIGVRTLQFVVAHQALVPPHRRGALLAITLQQGGLAVDGAYEPTAMSFDGHHVTMRFVYAGDPNEGDRFPGDASLDVDLEGDTASAIVQFVDRDWSGSIALPLARTSLASVSSGW